MLVLIVQRDKEDICPQSRKHLSTTFQAEKGLKIMEEPPILFTRPEILLHPNVPKPLHGLAPRTLIARAEWDRIRRETYARNNYHCFACGVYRAYDTDRKRFDNEWDESLDCHEFYHIDYDKKTVELIEFVALCKNCHAYVHSGRMQSMYEKGQLDDEDCYIIVNHGDRIISRAGLEKKVQVDSKDYNEEWKEWRLLFNGKEHFSKFLDYWDWYKHYMIGG